MGWSSVLGKKTYRQGLLLCGDFLAPILVANVNVLDVLTHAPALEKPLKFKPYRSNVSGKADRWIRCDLGALEILNVFAQIRLEGIN